MPRPGRSPPRAAWRRCRTACRSPRCSATRTPRCSPTRAGARAGQGDLRHRLVGDGAGARRRRGSDGLCLTIAWDRRRAAPSARRGQHPLHRRHAELAGRAARHDARRARRAGRRRQQRRRASGPGVQRPRRAVVGRRRGRPDQRAHARHPAPPQLARAALESIALPGRGRASAAAERHRPDRARCSPTAGRPRNADADAAAGRHQRAARRTRARRRDLSALGAAHLAGLTRRRLGPRRPGGAGRHRESYAPARDHPGPQARALAHGGTPRPPPGHGRSERRRRGRPTPELPRGPPPTRTALAEVDRQRSVMTARYDGTGRHGHRGRAAASARASPSGSRMPARASAGRSRSGGDRHRRGSWRRSGRLVVADVTSPDDVAALFAQARVTPGASTCWSTTPGIITIARLEDLTHAEWDGCWPSTPPGTFLCCQAAAARMREPAAAAASSTPPPARRAQGFIYTPHYAASQVRRRRAHAEPGQGAGQDGITVNAYLPRHRRQRHVGLQRPRVGQDAGRLRARAS